MRALMIAAAILCAAAAPLFDAPRAFAQDTTAQPTPIEAEKVNECALAFLKALRQKDVGEAMLHADVPFIAEDAKILKTEGELRDYLTKMLAAQQDDSVLPNAVFGVLDYGGSRGATAEEARALRDQVLTKADYLVGIGRDGFSRGVLLVKAKAGEPVVVGIGY
ncbi:MAG TPA: hypothetical protein VG742_03465 [Dongiaceae bacterium]|nr:hypothetical protein [Dongiaceae bacterium]